MAVPVIETFSVTENSGTSDSIVMTAPSGLSAGDLILIFVADDIQNSNAWPTSLTGYSVLKWTNNSEDCQGSWYYRIATGDSGDGFPLTITASGNYYTTNFFKIYCTIF